MAEDWIKMRKNLERHPKVLAMASAMSTDRFRIVGGLFAAWSLFDTYTEDGNLPAYTASALGEAIGWPGFGEAMETVKWLEVLPSGLVMPRFDTHNGESAKRRANDAERKRVSRLSADNADKIGTEIGLEKDKSKRKNQDQKPIAQQAARFDEFWKAYPSRPGTSKTGKKPCLQKWKARKLDTLADVILADIATRIRLDKQWKDGFIPDPLTYINRDRWDDGFSAGLPAAAQEKPAAVTKADIARAKIAQVEEWAKNMRAVDTPEAEIAEQVKRIRDRYEPDLVA